MEEPVYFTDPAALRSWLEEHHATATELHVGLWKKGTGRAGLTWSELVDQALCFGWIDGVGHRVDDDRWRIRITPRRPGSIWSAVNIAKVADLTAAGLMHPAGEAAFAARRADRSAVYSHEQAEVPELTPEQDARFRADDAAWTWFRAQAPSYRKAAVHWVVGAKRPETREKRLTQLIEDSAAGRTVPPLTRRGRP